MSETSKLGLPFIEASQAQKHVTHNEALLALDALVQANVIDRDLTAPPVTPSDGDTYIVASGASGDWSGKDLNISIWQDGIWNFHIPQTGFRAWIEEEAILGLWNGTAWVDLFTTLSALQNLSLLGVNATADATNKLTVASDAVLFNHNGNGIQHKLNKNVAGDTASFMFQTGFSGRAEMGTTGDDDFHFKVSSNGSTWNEALIADKGTGAARFPSGMEHAASREAVGQFLFTPGGDGEISIYRNDTTRSQNPRTAVISSISTDVITLTTTDAGLFFDDVRMNGVVYLRIWNTSKTPDESAWVKARPASNQLQVLDSADISGWASTETIEVGDPTGETLGRVIALDISPMLGTILGAVFRQSGILCKTTITPQVGFKATITMSPSGVSGSFVAISSALDGSPGQGMILIPCTELSPISNSNLVFVRESDGGGSIGVTLVSSIAVFG